jgi:hypothetical protein
MCEHIAIVTAARNALVSLRDMKVDCSWELFLEKTPILAKAVLNEVSRKENAYDAALSFFKIGDRACSPCLWVRRDYDEHLGDFVKRLDEFVDTYK